MYTFSQQDTDNGINNAFTLWFACEASVSMADPASDGSNTLNLEYNAETEATKLTLGTLTLGSHSDGRKCPKGASLDSWDVLATFEHTDAGSTIALVNFEQEYGSDMNHCMSSGS